MNNAVTSIKRDIPEQTRQPKAAAPWKGELLRLLRKKSVLYTLGALFAVVLLRVGVVAWLHRSRGEKDVAVSVVIPETLAMDESLKLPGNIEAIQQANLYAHITGYLKKIYVDEGDHVKKGQLLAELEAPDAIQEYRKAKAEADLKVTTRKRYDELLAQKVVSEQEFDTVAADANESQARLDNASANVQYMKITAPFTGSIARRFYYPGDLISGGMSRSGEGNPIFIIVNESELRIAVNVPQIDVSKIQLGHPVDVRVDSSPGEVFSGTVSRLDALLDQATKTQRVLIDLPNQDGKLKAGMFASVTLHVAHHDQALAVPSEAVDHDKGSNFVYLVKDGKLKRAVVTLGLVDSNRTEILTGVAAGDQVLSQAMGLPDGTPVQVSQVNGKPVSTGDGKKK